LTGAAAATDLAAQVTALRAGAGAFVLPRDVISVRGDDAESYLQGQLSQDVAALDIGASVDSLLLQPDGKLTALLRVTRLDGVTFLLDVDGGYGDLVTARLKKFLLRSKVEMERLDWRCVALRGAGVAEAAAGLLSVLAEAGVLAVPFEWNGWSGIDLLGPNDMVLDPATGGLPEGIVACGPDAVEACRITSGIPAMGSELGDKTIPAEAGLVERSVSFTKGCYTGQELVARLDSRGNNVPRRLVGVIGGSSTDEDNDVSPATKLAAGMTLHSAEPPVTTMTDAASSDTGESGTSGASLEDVVADKIVGSVTSATWSPELNAWVGLAYLHRSIEAPGPVRVRSGDGLGPAHRARVTTLPLTDQST
jgi:folate-binding protein YgfZ